MVFCGELFYWIIPHLLSHYSHDKNPEENTCHPTWTTFWLQDIQYKPFMKFLFWIDRRSNPLISLLKSNKLPRVDIGGFAHNFDIPVLTNKISCNYKMFLLWVLQQDLLCSTVKDTWMKNIVYGIYNINYKRTGCFWEQRLIKLQIVKNKLTLSSLFLYRNMQLNREGFKIFINFLSILCISAACYIVTCHTNCLVNWRRLKLDSICYKCFE